MSLGRIALLLLLAAAPAAAEPRIVSLGGAVTETVFALGQGGGLVGVDLTSGYPAGAQALPRVGYVRALGAEGILSLRPQLVLASGDAGPPAALRQIAAAGVSVVSLPEAHSPAAAFERVQRIGAALGQAEAGAAMTRRMEAEMAELGRAIDSLGDRPRVLFLLSAGRGAPMAAGRDTAADAMIRLAGGDNVMQAQAGYRPVAAEALLLAAPAVIVTTEDTLRGAGGMAGLVALPGLAGTPAGRAGRVVAFDALYLLGFGPRLPAALRDLAQALHPAAALPAPTP